MPEPAPKFFLSYARYDAEKPSSLIVRFFKDLEYAVKERTKRSDRLGTYDLRVKHGGDWDTELSLALCNDKVLVAIATPQYFGRINCGKEIAVFARRHAGARLDEQGCLRDTTNILHIRWLEDKAYETTGIKDAEVHPVLQKINWVPADDGDAGRSAAIARYRAKGMKMCVKPRTGYYEELLTALAQTIKAMPTLPEASFSVSWDNIVSAFSSEWSDIPKPAFAPKAGAPALTAPATPTGPGSVAIFYLTRRYLHIAPQKVSFAGGIVDPAGWRCAPEPISQEPYLSVVQAVQEACVQEGLNDFHCASIPLKSDALIDYLAKLTAANVIVAAVVDPTMWFSGAWADIMALDSVAQSPRWHGPILLPIVDEIDATLDLPNLVQVKHLGRAVAILPRTREEMANMLRSQLLQERGRITRADRVAEGERPPLPQGPGRSS